MSLQHAGLLRQVLQERGTLDTNPIVAALQAKVEAATAVFQEALENSWNSLTTSEIDVILAWVHVVTLAHGLANVMTADSVDDRAFPARHTFSVLEEQGYKMRGTEDMFRLAPLIARLLCSALPGFKAFLWLPPKMCYAFLAMQASTPTKHAHHTTQPGNESRYSQSGNNCIEGRSTLASLPSPALQPLSHSVTQSLSHSVTQSVTQSLSHSATQSACCNMHSNHDDSETIS
jgi:hypothetical protein